MNVKHARERGYVAGSKAARRVPFTAVSEALSMAALREAMPCQEGFAKSLAKESAPRQQILCHAFRLGMVHGIADTVRARRS